MEIEFPIEFWVRGTPVSLQAKRAVAREQWKEKVRGASDMALGGPYFAFDGPIAVTLYYLPSEPMQGDVDNIVKPILDALGQHIYRDDRQVERVVVQKFEPENNFSFQKPTKAFSQALSEGRPVLYVKISNNPTEELQ